jgi:hypothetical protein
MGSSLSKAEGAPSNQAAAEYIAFNYALDALVGLPLDIPSLLQRAPYRDFNTTAVASFLTRLVAHLAEQQNVNHHA